MTNTTLVQRAIEYIENHLKESLNISDVAEHIGFSKYHFTRIFKDQTGYKPSAYVKGRKVTEAIHYYLKEECRIIDAAFEYGFNSPEVFTRACLSAFSMSPSQIKKSVSDNTFKGVEAITPTSLAVYHQMSDFQAEETELPGILLKGYTYTSTEFLPSLDTHLPGLETLIGDKELIYHLHWSTEEGDKYYHLIGVPIDLSGMTDEDFNRYIYKRVPAKHYLLFPLTQEGKERETMNKHIYDNYLPSKGQSRKRTYAVEAVRLIGDTCHPTSLLYVPYQSGNPSRKSI